jgi:hypothetical protein
MKVALDASALVVGHGDDPGPGRVDLVELSSQLDT